eukprot:scaffold731_cov261-Pinguiococcus_pyrenoidosus.AAC.30
MRPSVVQKLLESAMSLYQGHEMKHADRGRRRGKRRLHRRFNQGFHVLRPQSLPHPLRSADAI